VTKRKMKTVMKRKMKTVMMSKVRKKLLLRKILRNWHLMFRKWLQTVMKVMKRKTMMMTVMISNHVF